MTEMDSFIGLVGNVSTEPELAYSAKGTPWLKTTLAVQPWRPKGEPAAQTTFYDLVAFGSLAENAAKTLSKGSRVAVVGTVEEDQWTGRDGIERFSLKLKAEAVGPDLRFATAKVNRSAAP